MAAKKTGTLSPELVARICAYQRNEITEHHIYSRLARAVGRKDSRNARVLERIAADELRHSKIWKKYTNRDIGPSRLMIFKYYWIARLFGLTFGIKLMERGEEQAQGEYGKIRKRIPEAAQIAEEEDRHESALLGLIEEEKLEYVGSIVLGLNDALVELTGALAGLSFALQKTRLIALTGLITGIAASFSMAASEYLSKKSEEGTRNPAKSAVYTGIAYIVTVFVLILPFLLLKDYRISLVWTLANAVLIILLFNYYIAVARDLPFKARFWEMVIVSLGVAAVTFGIGVLIRLCLGIEV